MGLNDSLFELSFAEGWNKYFNKLDNSEQQKIWKKIQKIKTLEKIRHLKYGLPLFVIETNQYRICFEEKKI
jgi:hypothetical protein